MQESFVLAEKRIHGNPLELHLRTFATSLREAGYQDRAMYSKLGVIADLGLWLRRTRLAVTSDLDEQRLEAFVKHKQRMHRGDLKTLQQFLDHLRKRGVVSDRKLVPDQSPLAGILSRYEQHLRSERRLVSATILNYLSFARKFLIERFPEGPLLLKEIKASDISDFVLRRGCSISVGRAQIMTTAFRSFFRYLFQKGELQADLAASVPTVADRRLSTVPKYLTPQEVECVLKACNRSTTRSGAATMPSFSCLPVSVSVLVRWWLSSSRISTGEPEKSSFGARVSFMTGCPCRQMWARHWRPTCGKTVLPAKRVGYSCAPGRHAVVLPSPWTLSTIVRRALLRADLDPPVEGTHLFRHSLATSLLRSGATMEEIGEVLRHGDPTTTEVYAKVDFAGLRSLAQPWPMGGAQ